MITFSLLFSLPFPQLAARVYRVFYRVFFISNWKVEYSPGRADRQFGFPFFWSFYVPPFFSFLAIFPHRQIDQLSSTAKAPLPNPKRYWVKKMGSTGFLLDWLRNTVRNEATHAFRRRRRGTWAMRSQQASSSSKENQWSFLFQQKISSDLLTVLRMKVLCLDQAPARRFYTPTHRWAAEWPTFFCARLFFSTSSPTPFGVSLSSLLIGRCPDASSPPSLPPFIFFFSFVVIITFFFIRNSTEFLSQVKANFNSNSKYGQLFSTRFTLWIGMAELKNTLYSVFFVADWCDGSSVSPSFYHIFQRPSLARLVDAPHGRSAPLQE